MRNYLLLAFLVVFVALASFNLPKYLYQDRLAVDNEPKNLYQNTVPPENSPTSAPAQTVKITLVGDIMLGRTVNSRSLQQKNPLYPFEKVADRLSGADIVFANLESPIVYDCPLIESGFTFCADPKMVEGLLYAGIDVVSIANNHNMNFGKKGYEETKAILAESGILWVGDGNLEIIEKGGIRFGFLGFDFVTNTTPGNEVFDLVRKSDTMVDVLIVGVHWGNEYKSIANSHQEKWAKDLIEAGADIIAGHHPHWVQNSEEVMGKKVYYSLGNFVFDQMWSEETKKGQTIELTFDSGNLVNEEMLAIYMINWAQPEWVSGD